MNRTVKKMIRKVVPIEVIRKVNNRLYYHKTEKLKKEHIVPYEPGKYPDGVNIIGNIRLDAGLGQSMRLVVKEFEQTGIPFGIYEHHITEDFSMTDHSCDALIREDAPYSVNLIHINGHEFTKAYRQIGREKWDSHYNIAFWLWELEEFPKEWEGCIEVLDEIWTPAEFVSEAVRKRTDKPVVTIPYHVEAPTDAKYDRAYFGLPEDRFLFLMMYDGNSMVERKNPIGVLKAFKQAFPAERQDVALVIKMNGKQPKDMAEIKKHLDGYTNVYFITHTMSKTEVNSLIADADVFVSMHRAEGFGLVMAEAMLNGVPCIATNWSANTEFMNGDVACMLDYTFVTMKHDIGPYKKGSRWAEPSVEQAAMYMRRLSEDREYYDRLSRDAKTYIEERLGMKRITGLIEDRLHEIW
jgi:glycosyltransferase involved in cell wall biosynthesis